MDFETPIRSSNADEVAAEAVRGLTNIRLGGSTEFVIQQVEAKARGSLSAVREARTLDWILAVETSLDFEYSRQGLHGGKASSPWQSATCTRPTESSRRPT